MQVSDFYYELPPELIAQAPLADRSGARMLVVSRRTGSFKDDEFRNIDSYVRSGDCLVLNDTRVFPARLRGRRNSAAGAAIEVLLVRPVGETDNQWKALMRPAKRVRAGDRILFDDELTGEIVSEGEFGERTIRFASSKPLREVFEKIGETPLPPYIHRKPGQKTPEQGDRERYQTVYAAHEGSVAAPTAGLHFTPEVLNACRSAGADIARVTLHVGLGTFAPLREESLAKITLHEESYAIGDAEAARMRAAERLVCVGTTSVRTVETALLRGAMTAQQGETNLFIHPGFAFRGTGAMLTNFHLPQSSLLMLVSAFAGRELTLAAYEHAVRNRYRFFSYGDCMFIE